MSDSTPSKRVILQRVRNRIIEYLSVASSFEAQRRYQANAPIANVPNEMINVWEDWVDLERRPDDYGPPVFSDDEQTAVHRFHQVWLSVAEQTPDPLPPLEETLRLAEWERLRDAAKAALAVFEARGTLPEDQEVWPT